ncbi:MAG: hypothetical protein JWR52_2614 [Marmoricola sp.]|nr:hypothetical protein [Marmoricola sp.]
MPVRRTLASTAVTLLTPGLFLGLVTGCGGSSKPAAAPQRSVSPTTTAYPTPVLPSNIQLERPKAASTIKATATLTAVPGASQLAAPANAPRTIEGFPVPQGAKVTDPGAIDDTWQFDIPTTDLNGVIAFYKRVLPLMGYTIRTDVTYTLGNDPVRWDIVFDGPVSGSLVRDRPDGTVFVVINPPGQPALPGDR